ncbi:MAG: polysaccharide biosynthesis tyrosine autokinase [Anaerolineales bacterium]|nr:polysaccharide biosynthesis tyrosine autokinase [Anaerolineales bacterium]
MYLRIFRKWLWFVVLVAFLGASISYITANRQRKFYRAEVTLFVGSFIQDPNPGSGEISLGRELARTYAAIVTTYDLIQAAIDAGDYPVSAGSLRGSISSEVVESTSLLKISVTYTDPILAADIANQLAEQLILRSPTNLTSDEQVQIDLLEEQIANINILITQTRQELDSIEEQRRADLTLEERQTLDEQRDVLLARITENSATLAQLYVALQGLQRQTNELRIVDRAQIPGRPAGLSTFQVSLIGALIGAILAYALSIVFEYLNDTVRTPEEATAILALPVLGTIFHFGRSNDTYPKRLVTYLHPSSPVAEGYRALRTNLLYSSSNDKNGDDKYAFVVTSAGPEEGKSVTAANLAVAMATAGLRVLLVDADLRRPKVHEIFDLNNELGLTTLLFADPLSSSESDMDQGGLSDRLRQCIQNTSIPRLRVITAGFSPSNPTEILGSALMKRWYDEFMASSNVDIVLFDTPPTLVVADSSVLAATINTNVLMVIRAGRTRRGAALRAKAQFENLNINVVGIALNQLNLSDQGAYYGYKNSYYYYSGEVGQNPPAGWRRFIPRFNRSR